MSQIIVLGISGLDVDLLRVYRHTLPHLRHLMLASPFLELKSTLPPEPVPAWASVYTGLSPANHGMLEKMDCLERSLPDALQLQEETFWEKAARAGKEVCVLNPLLARPECSLPGLFLSSSTSSLSTESTPPAGSTFPPLMDEPLIPPASQLATFCTSLWERTEQQVAIALEHLARKPWDLFFVQLDTLDYIQHFLWRYSDPGDPMYPGQNEHANRIRDFYQLFDQIIGRFRAARNGDSVLAIVSSHGHERRCTYRLHVNEWLRTQGYLTHQGQAQLTTGATEEKENIFQQLFRQSHLQSLFSWLAQCLPWSTKYARVVRSIDQQTSIAQLVELASATSPYGGIRLNRALIEREQKDYEQVRTMILAGLEELSTQNRPVVNWARRREEYYQGKHLDGYPDILFELRSDLGVGRGLHTPLIVPDSTHRLISGTHSPHGVFLLENWPEEIETYEDIQGPSVMDVAPTILGLLGVEAASMDGQALVHPYPVRQLI
jgi:predicted AlkP superfamily phosphohydrolase/phosphomutase